MTLPATAPYGDLPVPPDVAVVGLDVPVGRLTALVAAPDATPRGLALLVPGFTGSKEDFSPVLPLLRAQGWAVVAYSRRGQPDSVQRADRADYALDREARDVLDVAALVAAELAPGLPLHLLGHSYGGLVARAAVLADPAPFASFTLFCSGPRGWALREGVAADDVRATGEQSLATLREQVAAARHAVDGGLGGLPPDARFLTRRLADASLAGLEASVLTLQTVPDATDDLAAATRAHGIPVHVVHGDADDAWPVTWQREMAERLGAQYTVIPDAGHSAQHDRPQAVAQAWSGFWADAPS